MTHTARRLSPWRGACAAACLWGAAFGVAEAQTRTMPPCERPVLTLAEAAALLRVDESELERFAANAEVPGRRIGTDWRFACAALMTWLSRGRSPEEAEAASGASHSPQLPSSLSTASLAGITAKGSGRSQADAPAPAASPPDADSQERPIGTAPQERTAEDVFLRGQRVLLGPGDVVLDVGQFLARRDDLLFTTTGDAAGLATVERRALTTVVVGRVGLFSETELFAGTSYSVQHSRQFIGGMTLSRADRSALGATTVGLRRTFLRERVRRPGVIATIGGQVPTDDVPAAVAAGAVLIKSVDPLVLFANASYVRAFRHESGDESARFRSADVVDLAMGYGLGLNDTVAISLAVAGAFARTTALDGASSRRPSSFSARFGLTAWLARGLYIEPSFSFGLTGPGETVAFGVTLPYAF